MKYRLNNTNYYVIENVYFRKELISFEWNPPKIGSIREVPFGKIWVWKIGERTLKNFFKKEVFWAVDSGMRFLAYDKVVDEFFSRINKFII